MEGILGTIFATSIVATLLFLFNKLASNLKRNAIAGNSKNVKGNIDLGMLAYQKNKNDEALRFFNNIDRNVDIELTCLADYFKAMIFLKKRMLLEAQENFKFVIENRTKIKTDLIVASSYYHLGYIFYEEKNILEAKKYKDLAVNIDSSCLDYDSVSTVYRDL